MNIMIFKFDFMFHLIAHLKSRTLLIRSDIEYYTFYILESSKEHLDAVRLSVDKGADHRTGTPDGHDTAATASTNASDSQPNLGW